MNEVAFPRGKAPSISSKDPRKQHDSSKKRSQDVLFGNNQGTMTSDASKKTKTTKGTTTTEHTKPVKKSLLPLGGGGVIQPKKGLPYIEALSFNKLAKGVRLLAFVREVHADLVIFSLPNQWTGFMLVDQEASGYDGNKMLKQGQLLSVQIVKASSETTQQGSRRRIQVTVHPVSLNPKDESINVGNTFVRGQVVSVEDHGVLVSLGLQRRGFLPFDEIEPEYSVEDDDNSPEDVLRLNEGRILDFVVRVTGKNNEKIVPLCYPNRIHRAKKFLPATHTPTLDTLLPGTLVHGVVEEVIRNGLAVTFAGGVFRGAIESHHLGAFWVPEGKSEGDEWKVLYDRNRSITARIIAVDPATKLVRLSLLQHLLELRVPHALPSVGSVHEKATVLRLDTGLGALLALPNLIEETTEKPLHKRITNEESYLDACRVQTVYVHISKAMDEREDGKTSDAMFAKMFAPSTQHSVRILGSSNLIEGIGVGATAPSIVQAHVLSHTDIIPGKKYKQVPIKGHSKDGGVLVDLGMGVRGKVPATQLFDKASTSEFRDRIRQTKYAIGAKLDVRVLTTDILHKKCVLTAKKALLNCSNIITSFDVKLGERATGFVSKVDKQGIAITFFNGVFGRVSARSLKVDLGIDDPQSSYAIGDTVDCVVVNKVERKGKKFSESDNGYWELTLSLRPLVDSGDQMVTIAKPNDILEVEIGKVIPARAMKIIELFPGKQKGAFFVPGYAVISIKSKHLIGDSDDLVESIPQIECKLPFDQIFDDYAPTDIQDAKTLDKVAREALDVGKKVNRKAIILHAPKKSRVEYYSGIGKLITISIKPKFVAKSEQQNSKSSEELECILPRYGTPFSVGASLLGYVSRLDPKHGAFIRFLGEFTGLVPKQKGGLHLPLLSTIVTKVTAIDDSCDPKKILLSMDNTEEESSLPSGSIKGIIKSIKPNNAGLIVRTEVGINAFAPVLELSTDTNVLDNLSVHFPLNSSHNFHVLDGQFFKYAGNKKMPILSLLDDEARTRPRPGALVTARINRKLHELNSPSLMVELRGGFQGRCCITELDEPDDWVNMPLGKPQENIDRDDTDEAKVSNELGAYRTGEFVRCRVLSCDGSKKLADVSLRPSRIEGDFEDDEDPEVDDVVQAYVVKTTKQGCFVRLSRTVEGRVLLKELCDGFLPNPSASFPMGRLVVGKVKSIQDNKRSSCKIVDLDMRESTLLEQEDRLQFDHVNIGDKFKGTVARIEEYGVFVRLENSDVTGLVHKSECSDKYIKNLQALFDPGDLVKILVIKKDSDGKKLGFSMKASHFEDDEDSDDEELGVEVTDLDSDDDDMVMDDADKDVEEDVVDGSDAESSSANDDDNDSASSGKSSESSSSEQQPSTKNFDTNVGFDWDGSALKNRSKADTRHSDNSDSDSDSDTDSAEDMDAIHKSSHKSRRKQAQKLREEKEIARREAALADGTADERPETADDFERLIAGDPNSSMLWIQYMAFHLSSANIPAARQVAEMAFERMEFRHEKEKLNVWVALLTLEFKYGTEEIFEKTIVRACEHNNPKQVYLRVCEIMEKELVSPSSTSAVLRVDEMYKKACKKFKDKKTVWIAYMRYLLHTHRQDEAHAVSKRALLSLPEYKHVETMSKFAQLMYEYGAAEKARTIFDGLLYKFPKRLDLFFVYVDKEVKQGDVEVARQLFERAGSTMKLSDKQMKSLFKKWYAMEEMHGTDETQEHVKDAARAYVERS